MSLATISLYRNFQTSELQNCPLTPTQEHKASLRTLLAYVAGEGASTLTMNGIANFATLYYTQILGLGAQYVGLAVSVSLLWDALLEPVIGHVSDNTRSRFGRRHPYMLLGGLILGGSFYFLWLVPKTFAEPTALFWYVLTANLVVRSAFAAFVVPYTSLGFEICRNYDERSRLQGLRFGFNQAVNFLGGALAWSLFFRDRSNSYGARMDGTQVAENYVHMSVTLTLAALIFVCVCVYSTRRYAVDNRKSAASSGGLRALAKDCRSVITDRNATYIFAFFALVSFGAVIVSQAQTVTYVNYMKFDHIDKTIVHGAGMVACAIGALLQSYLVIRIDKRQTGYCGIAISIAGSVALLILFTGGVFTAGEGWIVPAAWPGLGGSWIPISTLSFALFQGMWWGGMGVLGPLAFSMIADVSEINSRKTGFLRNGSYSAMLGFVTNVAGGAGVLVNGWMLERAGYVSGGTLQSAEAVRDIALLTFVSGPLVMLCGLPILFKYPIDRTFMTQLANGACPDAQRGRGTYDILEG